jgi:hypothetical protein
LFGGHENIEMLGTERVDVSTASAANQIKERRGNPF